MLALTVGSHKEDECMSRDLISLKVSAGEIVSFPSVRGRGVVTFIRRDRAVELRDSLTAGVSRREWENSPADHYNMPCNQVAFAAL